MQPLVPIIAAGNTAIVKLNEMSPATSAAIAAIIGDSFDEQQVAVFEGGVDLAEALLDLPVDHVFFTGSPKVGKHVMARAAEHLASVTLELGGKCPVILDRTADVLVVARMVAEQKALNNGQLCLTPDHVWVTPDVRDEFVAHYLDWVRQNLYTEEGLDRSATSRIIDDRNTGRLRSYLVDAVDRGAELVRAPSADHDPAAVEPTVLLGAPLDAAIMQDEIFGPLLPVQTYQDVTDVLTYLRAGGKPLAMYIHSRDRDFVDTVIRGTSSGGVTVNGGTVHWAETRLPFGGVNTSGMGAYHGINGFRELSHARAVVIQPADPIGTPEALPAGT